MKMKKSADRDHDRYITTSEMNYQKMLKQYQQNY